VEDFALFHVIQQLDKFS